MANLLSQQAFDAAERQAHEYNKSGQMCYCIECQCDVPDGPPPEFQIVAHIKNGMKPDGTFRAKSSCGAEISLHIDQEDRLVLIVDDSCLSAPHTTRLGWVLKC